MPPQGGVEPDVIITSQPIISMFELANLIYTGSVKENCVKKI